MGVNVRPMLPGDVSDVIEMGRAMHAESPRYLRFAFSEDKVAALVRAMTQGTMATEAPGGAFVAERAGIVIGMVGGYVAEPFFSRDKVASDYALYVVPEFRKGRAALLLVRAFEAWATEQGVLDIVPGVTTMVDDARTARFYEGLGYERAGHILLKRIR